MKKLLIITYIALAVFLFFRWDVIKSDNDKYNAWVCANQGMEADCSTPLPEERKLK